MKAAIPYIIIALLAAALAVVCMRGCGKTSPPDPGAAIMAAKQAGWDSAQRIDTPEIIVLQVEKDSLTDVVNDLLEDKILLQFQLDTLGDRIGNTLVSTDEARVKHDTVMILQNCDSLEALVKQGIPVVTGYTHLTDSLVQVYVSKGIIQDSIIAKLTRDNALAGSTITAQQLAYEIIHKDDQTKTAELKIYRPVAIGGAAIIVGYIVLKILLK